MGNGKLLSITFFNFTYLEIPSTPNRQSAESDNAASEPAQAEQQSEEKSIQPPVPPRRQFSNEASKLSVAPPVPVARTTPSQRFQFESNGRTPPPLPPKPNVSF
jgi:hypothetical protein